jgi:signal peptidase I
MIGRKAESKGRKGESLHGWTKKSVLGRAWHFLWHEDSWLSWLANIALAFLLIKFVFYPLIGFLLGTSFPVVAVVSTSMEHHSPLGEWWEKNDDQYLEFNITRSQFEKFPFKNGFNKGDLMILVGKKPQEISIGDIIVFQTSKPYPIIHRVIARQEQGMWVFQTKGDNNKAQIRDKELDETRVLEKQLLGRAAVRVPWIGYVKIWFVNLLNLAGIPVA